MKKRKWFVLLLTLLLSVQFAVTSKAQEETSGAEERRLKAENLGVKDWLDEEGYLTDLFFEGKSDQQISEMGLDGLIRTWTQEEVDTYAANLKAGIGMYTVTRYEKVSQTNPSTGRLLYTGIFEVDGILAFCMERSVTTPARGSSTGAWQEVSNDNVRKVLYYGYNGPENKGYTYVETALATGEANGDGDNSLGRNVLAQIAAYPSPPSSFKVWKVETNGGSTQDLAFYTIEEKGYLQISKISGNTGITDGNANYSLEGAVYGVYADAACTAEIGRVTTNAEGVTSSIALEAGTYYIKELSAPQGYEVDEAVQSAVIVSSQTTVITVSEQPRVVVPDIFIQKKDAATGEANAQDNLTFLGTQFQVKFFRGSYGVGVNPETLGAAADRTWIFEADENGVVRLEETYLVSGDALWENESKRGILPYGTITIQEIQAPNGYQLNPEIFVKNLAHGVNAWQTVDIFNEKIMRIPNTGGMGIGLFAGVGTTFCVAALKTEDSEIKKEKQRGKIEKSERNKRKKNKKRRSKKKI